MVETQRTETSTVVSGFNFRKVVPLYYKIIKPIFIGTA
jgi:hypothetical protein